MRRLLAIAAATGLLVGLLGGPAAANGLPAVNIDSGADASCEIESLGFEWNDGIHVTINKNWIIATCHAELDGATLAALGGPFDRAHIHRGFDCEIGDDEETFDDVPATKSHAVITPTARLNVVCKAPVPD